MENNLFHALNEFFDQIYVLTLPRAKDRHDHISHALQGLQYQLFYGFDGSQYSLGALLDEGLYDPHVHQRIKRGNRGMSKNEIACALSHRAMYEDMVNNGYQCALILEDDATPIHDHLENFETAMADLPADWDFLMLGYRSEKSPNIYHRLQQVLYQVYRRLSLFDYHKVSREWIRGICMEHASRHLWRMGKCVGGHAYALTQETARHFIAYQTPIILQADRVFYYYMIEHGLNAYLTKQRMFTLSDLSKFSYIGYARFHGLGAYARKLLLSKNSDPGN